MCFRNLGISFVLWICCLGGLHGVQAGAKQDFKDAGHSMKTGFKKTGHGIKKGAKKTGHAFKQGG